ncbi:MAG TPA: ABC transporter permease [Candidatus Acidoferrum sp.]|nr:ABC transporter permease [Candidatus Acidoferrum sp.]
MSQVRSWMRAVTQGSRMESEMDAELRFHIEAYTEDFVRAGVPREEALRRARIEFGGIERAKEECRDARGVNLIDSLIKDSHFGLRILHRNPGFTAIAVLTLALGIGANTAIFSISDAFIRKPLPFPRLDRIVNLSETQPALSSEPRGISPANFLDWQSQARSYESVSAWTLDSESLTGHDAPLKVEAARVSPNFFTTLGAKPLWGRAFSTDSDAPGSDQELILTRRFWQGQLGADPNIWSKRLRLNGHGYTVIGIMDQNVNFPPSVDVWTPMTLKGHEGFNRKDRYLRGVARLRKGVSLQQADSESKTIAQRLSESYPVTNRGWNAQVSTLTDWLNAYIIGPFVVLMSTVVAFVLLIACANVANLQFVRASVRQKEIAVRTAVGAGRGRLIRQMLTESLILGFAGAAAGMLIARWSLRLFVGYMPADIERFVPGWDQIRLDMRALLFAIATAGVAGILAGLVPALRSSRVDLNAFLKEGARGLGELSSHKFRDALAIAQIALALVLLVGAGLMVKGFHALLDMNRRYQPETLLTMRVTLPYVSAYDDAQRRLAFYDRALERLAAIPSVRYAITAKGFPFSGLRDDGPYWVEGHLDVTATAQRVAVLQSISPNYFLALGVPLLEGREFGDSDGPDAPPVGIVARRLARAEWPSSSAIGRRLKVNSTDASSPWLTIVGVVDDVHYVWMDRAEGPAIYRPYRQAPQYYAAFALRAAGDTVALVPAARAAIAAVDPEQPIFEVKTMARVISESTLPIAYLAVMLGVAGALAVLLASLGVYGVMAFGVTERTHEIGVRMALGANRYDTLRLILRRGMVLAAVGIAIGLPCALVLARLSAYFLYGVRANDPFICIAASVMLAGVALLACYIPARRAMRVDPIVALRYE